MVILTPALIDSFGFLSSVIKIHMSGTPVSIEGANKAEKEIVAN